MAGSRPARAHDAEGAKQRIMRAAEKLFAERGYAATSVAQIAHDARANRALLYYYFRDKRDLYWAVLENGLEGLLRLVDDASEALGSPQERLERFVRSYYELLVSRHDVIRMTFREMMCGDERLRLPVRKHLRELHTRVRRLIEQGLESGDFHGIDPDLTAFSLFGMIHVFLMERLETGRSFATDAVVEHTLQLFRHGAQAPPAHRAVHSRKGNAKRKK